MLQGFNKVLLLYLRYLGLWVRFEWFMAEAERSCLAAASTSDSRGEKNLALASLSVETKTVSGSLCRECHPSRSCPWGMDCICFDVVLLNAFCFRASGSVSVEVTPGFQRELKELAST